MFKKNKTGPKKYISAPVNYLKGYIKYSNLYNSLILASLKFLSSQKDMTWLTGFISRC